MKAIVCTKYGAPEVLKISEIEKPVPNENEVLVKVNATAITATDAVMRALKVPGGHGFLIQQLMKFAMRLFIGFNKPRNPVLGLVFSGVVEEVGDNVKHFVDGDEIFGFTGQSRGCYSEYKIVSNKEIEAGEVVLKPKNVNHNEAAAIIYGGTLVMHFMKNIEIKKGQKVLIYGASGAIGTIAMQVSKYYQAEITAVCSSKNSVLVKSIGAKKLLDYTNESSINQLDKYDFVFDAVGENKTSKLKRACRKALTKNGKYVSVDDGLLKVQPTYLSELNALIETGNIKAIIDRQYLIEEIVEAHEYVDKGHKKGNVIMTIG